MSLAGDDLEHVIVVPGRYFAPTASAGSVTAVSGDEVAGGGAVAHAVAVVLAEGRVNVLDSRITNGRL
jgi:hypothetical protein